MENIIVLKKSMADVINDFPQLIEKDKQMIIKRLNGRKFHLASADAYSKNLSMPEHPHYFVSGEFIDYRYETHVKYNIRANATLQILAIVVPLMALPTLFFGLPAFKSGDYLPLILNSVIYLILVGLSIYLYLSQRKKMQTKGDKQFREMFEKLE
jgi:hypothetical protein